MKHFLNKNHNHSKCSARALSKAYKYCDDNKLLFSPMRQMVFKIIWNSHKSISAYDLLDILKKENKKTVATTVYRALDFLEKNNLVHKIHSSNTYIGCSYIGEKHTPILFICKKCGEIGEMFRDELFKGISKTADNYDFSIENSIIEIEGTCPWCKKI